MSFKLNRKFNEGDKVLLSKSFQGSKVIDLAKPLSQSVLKHLFELGVDYVVEEEKPKK